MPRIDNLTVNQQGQRQISVSQMTDGKDETWSPVDMSVAKRRPWSMVADCSTPALQPQATCRHRVDRRVDGTSIIGESTERRRRQAATSDVSRRLSACRYARAVPCIQWYARTHTAGTGFAPGRVASAAAEEMESCASTHDVSRRVVLSCRLGPGRSQPCHAMPCQNW